MRNRDRFMRGLIAGGLMFAVAIMAQEAVRPRIGLVLSGGGAKGVAHVGLLKALDSLAIPVDYITGTSMGSIVGGLYAAGYTGAEVGNAILSQNWPALFSDYPPRNQLPYPEMKRKGRYQMRFGLEQGRFQMPSGLIQGQNIRLKLAEMLSPYDALTPFDDLPIPFRCVAVDLKTPDPIILERGNLAKAIRASMSIPSAFAPVKWEDYTFVDGGMLNNFPVDVARNLGAELVIGMDVSGAAQGERTPRTLVEVLNSTLGLLGIKSWQRNVAETDLYIVPDLTGYSLMDFEDEAVAGIIAAGERASRAAVDSLLALKHRYHLNRYTQPLPKVHYTCARLRLHGLFVLSRQDFLERLDLPVGKAFSLKWLDERLKLIQAGQPVDTVFWEVIPENATHAEVRIRVRESKMPRVEGVEIHGQRAMPFGALYRHLDVRPGERLDRDKIARNIMDLYGLGYFKRIEYDLEPTESGYVRLHLHVEEKARRQLTVGFHADSHYQFVLGLGSVSTNFPFPGLRMESDLKLVGLTEFGVKIYYPSRNLNFPVYPVMMLDYHSIPIDVYDDQSHRIATYDDRASSMAYGLALQAGRHLNLMGLYKVTWMDIKPGTSLADPVLFPSWRDRLNEIALHLDYDSLDDRYAPRQGMRISGLYEGSYRRLTSQHAYQRFSAELDLYVSASASTWRANLFFARASDELPVYKWFNRGRAQYFVGMRPDQLAGQEMTVFRAEYQYWMHPSTALKIIGNMAPAFNVGYLDDTAHQIALWGYGVGLQMITPLGLFEVGVGRGDKHWTGSRAWQTVGFLRLGALF